MKLIKPIIKINESKNYLASWIIEKFPENYRELKYVEPFLGSGSVMLNKDTSIEEVGNEFDLSVLQIWRSIRDEPKLFFSKIKKIDYKESIFLKYKNKKENDYLNAAVVEFAVRQMSKSGLKKNFLPIKKKTKDYWSEILANSNQIQQRLKKVFLINKSAIETVWAFGGKDSLIYCDIPEQNSELIDENKHMELAESLVGSKGKVIIAAKNCAMYKRLYSSWNRKSVPGNPKESAWFNF